jgi:membrane protein insertase Oxa1/YidC/SpoIIIJ/rhodanese-related sulfurtransferase/phosphohistidine swiveling domain-containing protein
MIVNLAWVVAVFVWFATPAYAIPSPDLVAGSISSLSQLFALASALVGGLAFTGTGIGRGTGGSKTYSPRSRKLRLMLIGGACTTLCVSLGFNAYQYLSAQQVRLDRLQATLIRPSHQPGQPILDPTLKEESFSEQSVNPLGVSTEEVAQLLREADAGGAKDVNFIDIREAGETALGILPHFTAVRWPDLAKSGIDLKNKRNVFICHNGNRSSETAEALAALGIKAQFMVGGLEKWIAEGRPVGNSGLRSPAQLRGVPRYRNDNVLLDTPEVQKLVQKEHAVFVDTRYPGAFENSHLPGAYNIPIRKTPTPELEQSIRALPHEPIVLACYDRRSCFMSTALGLMLTRAGFDVRGRYTQPWDYFVPTPEASYVAAWRARIDASTWRMASRKLGAALSWSAHNGVGLPLAIFLLALASRMIVIPFSFKAERDQIKMRALAPVMAEAKERYAGDPKRFARYLKAFHREHGITPARNLLALLFLPVLAICVAGVDAAAHSARLTLWWMADLARPDPLYVLPALFGAGVAFYLAISLARTRMQQALWGAGGFVAFTVLAAFLSAAVNLYLVTSVVIMLAQRGVLSIDFAAARQRIAVARAARRGWVPLAQASLLPGCGNKASRLGAMRAAGLPVPNGAVLTPVFLDRLAQASHSERAATLDRLWRRLGAVPLAVRSSAAAEDGTVQSFAGVFDTVLHVDRAGLADAIARVASSFAGARSETYAGERQTGYILLQPMVAAEYAGVLFTRAPASGAHAMIEMVRGTADGFVSGQEAPETFLLGRFTGRLFGEQQPPMDIEPLFRLGRRVEAMFGKPQDVEWAYSNGQFLLLQSRDITRTPIDDAETGAPRLEAERARLVTLAASVPDSRPAFAQNELSELLPRPSAIALDLMESLWQSGGSVDLACRALGLSYTVDEASPAFLVTAFGRLYVNKAEEHKRSVRIGRVGAMRLERGAETIEREFTEEFLPAFRDRVRLLDAIDYSRLTLAELHQQLERVRQSYVGETCARVEVINIAAAFYIERAKSALSDRGLNAVNYLGDLEETPLAHALATARRGETEEQRIDSFISAFGHRAPLDYELHQPRYSEDRAAVALLVSVPLGQPNAGHDTKAPLDWPDKKLQALVERARRFQLLKEQAKHEALREIAVLRRILVELDRRLELRDGIYQLSFAEIAALGETPANMQAWTAIRRRRAEAELFAGVPPFPAELDLAFLESASLVESASAADDSRTIAGTLVSGGAPITGRALVVMTQAAERGDPITDFVDGDIIVARMIHAAWLPYFSRAGGLVCEVGGWLSHIAILAREYDLPLVIGASGLAGIRTGELLQIETDGRILRSQEVLPAASERALPAIVPLPDEPVAGYVAAAQ